jgi:hypothetical protein
LPSLVCRELAEAGLGARPTSVNDDGAGLMAAASLDDDRAGSRAASIDDDSASARAPSPLSANERRDPHRRDDRLGPRTDA